MTTKGSRKGHGRELTSRQQEWLGHLKACQRAGERMCDYAKREGLSVQAMYQAAKELRRRGVLAKQAPKKTSGSFVPVQKPSMARTPEISWRVRFPSGVVLEGAGVQSEGVDHLLEALARLR